MTQRIAVLATASHSGEVGGAERFYVGLRDALRREGAAADIVSVVSDESSFDAILESYLRFYELDLSAFDGVISTKAPGYVVRHPNHVCYLQHTMRVFYDMFEVEFPAANDVLQDQRRRIQQLDTAALSCPRLRGRFVIGEEVRARLLRYNGLEAEILHQATTMSGYRCGAFEYLFMPGRLHRWKRVDLVVRAMRYVSAPVQLLISGTGEDEASLKALAAKDERIRFLGRVTDDELISLYANALAVPFVPLREDFGLVSIEAFHSGKPVITCEDSGEPARLVRAFDAGWVCPPEPKEIAVVIDRIAAQPRLARDAGERGRGQVGRSTWGMVATTLLTALQR